MNKPIARSFVNKFHLPATGELREPIVLFRSTRVPNDTVGFNQTLDKYGNAWARVVQATVKWQDGAQCDPFTQTVFTIRNNRGLVVQNRDAIDWNGRFFRVMYTQIIDTDQRWLTISCREDVIVVDGGSYLTEDGGFYLTEDGGHYLSGDGKINVPEEITIVETLPGPKKTYW